MSMIQYVRTSKIALNPLSKRCYTTNHVVDS